MPNIVQVGVHLFSVDASPSLAELVARLAQIRFLGVHDFRIRPT